MAQGEAPLDSSADPCTQMSLCSGGTSLSASACKSAAEHRQTCARSAPACCGLSHLERGNPNWPGEDEQKKKGVVIRYTRMHHMELELGKKSILFRSCYSEHLPSSSLIKATWTSQKTTGEMFCGPKEVEAVYSRKPTNMPKFKLLFLWEMRSNPSWNLSVEATKGTNAHT